MLCCRVLYGMGVIWRGWIISFGYALTRADLLGLPFGVGMLYWMRLESGAVLRCAVLRWMAGTAPGVLFLVFRLCVRLDSLRTLFFVGLADVVIAGDDVSLVPGLGTL